MESESVCSDEEDEGEDDKLVSTKEAAQCFKKCLSWMECFCLQCTFCLHFFLINIHIFDYPDSRLSGLFTEVPTSPDNRDSTVLFNLVKKNILLYLFFGWNALVPLCCVHCARFDILTSFFSEAKCKPAKNIQGNVLLLNWKAHAKIQALLKEKIFAEKVTYDRLAPSHSIMRCPVY